MLKIAPSKYMYASSEGLSSSSEWTPNMEERFKNYQETDGLKERGQYFYDLKFIHIFRLIWSFLQIVK